MAICAQCGSCKRCCFYAIIGKLASQHDCSTHLPFSHRHHETRTCHSKCWKRLQESRRLTSALGAARDRADLMTGISESSPLVCACFARIPLPDLWPDLTACTNASHTMPSIWIDLIFIQKLPPACKDALRAYLCRQSHGCNCICSLIKRAATLHSQQQD